MCLKNRLYYWINSHVDVFYLIFKKQTTKQKDSKFIVLEHENFRINADNISKYILNMILLLNENYLKKI